MEVVHNKHATYNKNDIDISAKLSNKNYVLFVRM